MARRALGPAALRIVQAVEQGTAVGPLLVACSGGADSLALACAAGVVAGRRGTSVRALIVDHGLQDGSGEVSGATRRTLLTQGIEAEIVAVAVDGVGGPEAAARQARYSALTESAVDGEQILLGHTLDDQAESVLLGLARGSGTRSLAGMPARRGALRRPLLAVRRAETEQACREWGVEPWHDPHNADPAYLRSRVRTQVMPVLEDVLGPGVAEALARTALLARDDADLLDSLVSAGEARCEALAGLPPALRRRSVRRWMVESGVAEPSAVHVVAVDALVTGWHGQAGVDVPGGRVVRTDGSLRFTAR